MLEHPILKECHSTRAVCEALERSHDDHERLNRDRKNMCQALHRLAKATEAEDLRILEYVHPRVKRVLVAYGIKKLAFMREVCNICGCMDDEAVMHLAIGLPLLGWAPAARGLMDRKREPECTIDEFLEGRKERNAKLIQRLKSTGDDKLDATAYQKTMEEVKAGVLEGPFLSLEATGFSNPCVVPRHGILEMHGDATEETVRNIDVLLMGEQNRRNIKCASAHRC